MFLADEQTNTHTHTDGFNPAATFTATNWGNFSSEAPDHPGIFHVLCTTRFVMLLEVPVEPLILARDSLYMYICIFF